MMLKLKLQYSGHLTRRADSLEKTLDDRGWDGWMASLTWWTGVWVNSRRWWWTRRPGVLQFMGSQSVGHGWATELNWTELIDGKESAYNAGDPGLIPWPGRSPAKGMATHSSVLAWRIWWTEEPGGLQSIGLQRVGHDWETNTFTFQIKFLKSMTSLVAQIVKNLPKIQFNPWIQKIPWRRKWQPTPVFLPEEFHGRRSLVGYSQWGCKESDTTEVTAREVIKHFFLIFCYLI